ncbi:MAG TPA: hypothetical protein VF843_07850 [Streptosporangiaceae bacterium]
MTRGDAGQLDSAGRLDGVRAVADAILYEGYLLYPYRQTSQKNQSRFQFGVLMPPGYAAVDPTEPSASQTECLLECADDAHVLVTVRFLQLQRRRIEQVVPDTGQAREVEALTVDGTEYTAWTEAVEREQQVCAEVGDLLTGDLGLTVHVPAGQDSEDIVVAATGRVAGRIVRAWDSLDAVIRLQAARVAGPYGALKLGVRTENHTIPVLAPLTRDDGLAGALIAAHTLIHVPGGSFLSMTDPPEWAAAEIKECENISTWPVLAGPPDRRDMMLSSPVILYDHPEIAPESAGDLFDATEIDEILTLRTLALTDEEKRAARATDPRAADLLDRLDDMPAEMFERLHGAIRYLRAAGQPVMSGPAGSAGPAEPGQVPWWDPGADASVSPETDQVLIDGVPVSAGCRVVMLPGIGSADAQDLFLAGREATVQAVFHDVDGSVHVAVSPDGDPAADLQRSHGRFLYFAASELRPLSDQPPKSQEEPP